jgi:hypothetical protein
MKKIEVLASSLKFTAIGDIKATVLMRNDHFSADKISEGNLKLMLKQKLVKYVDEEGPKAPVEKTKSVKASKVKDEELTVTTEGSLTDTEAKEGEF